jgi:hypothetical protein
VRYPPLANSQLRRSERKSEGSGGSKKISSMRDEFENGSIGRIYDLGQSYSAFRTRTKSWFGCSATHFKSGCQLDLEAGDIIF